MPTLDFKGKQFVYSHHLSVPFREIKVIPEKSLPEEGKKPSLDNNLIIHGDNLEALKALLPTHAGKVDCIFIDPPYNTGNEGWCYNDNVRSPLMQEWLKKSANPVDGEDMERHDKWLCMMWPRLQLLKELLSDTGAIFMTIDDHEANRLEAIGEEIFGSENNLGRIVVRLNPKGRHLDQFLAKTHEYVLVFTKNIQLAQLSGVDKDEDMLSDYDKEDENGLYRHIELRNRNSAFNPDTRPKLYYPIYVNPETKRVSLKKDDEFCDEALPLDGSGSPTCWTWGKVKFEQENHLLVASKTREGHWRVFRKDYLNKDGSEVKTKPKTIWLDPDLNMDESRKVVSRIFGKNIFDFPKPVPLVEKILQMATSKNSIVLDSFAGSGTTAHAVLSSNDKDNGNRKFILIECENYADELTAERVRRVMNGYPYQGTEKKELYSESITWSRFQKKQPKIIEEISNIEAQNQSNFDKINKSLKDGQLIVTGERKVEKTAAGLGGSFAYCSLGEPIRVESLLSGSGMPSFESLSRYVFYTATGKSLQEVAKVSADGFIGETDLFRVHLFYRPEADWLRSNEAALNAEKIAAITSNNPTKKRTIVFAVAKFMSQKELTEHRIEFCQLPYAIHRIMGA
ncbi:site-specific DNA-methyltransferase [Idiomarina ramblicola]|uniref:site-specific DNA-methyltransferase (adenine-specific) n=1 Tax=Idiomarina ramblicola TaxID=263724 RepID=A0A432Z1A3_9GAMM|nr:site-specific DNA-methyltransferase [Idiomarina ramblicola]RUO71657.1 site-specific DNA-methyltransferase [Idiomarina ramblicola]